MVIPKECYFDKRMFLQMFGDRANHEKNKRTIMALVDNGYISEESASVIKPNLQIELIIFIETRIKHVKEKEIYNNVIKESLDAKIPFEFNLALVFLVHAAKELLKVRWYYASDGRNIE